MAPKILVVVGITGKQGGSVANHFLANPSWKIRGIVRDPTKSSAQAWSAKAVELVRADLDDVESLKRAFAGAHAIFAMTDYWVPMGDEKNLIEAKERGVIVNEVCHDLELQRAKNLAIAAASVPSLERYIFSTLSATSYWSKGKYKNVWHFDSKAAAERYIRESPEMQDLAAKSSFLQVGLYLENWKSGFGFEFLTKDKSSRKWYHSDIGDGNRKLPLIWTVRDTGVLVEALLNAEPRTTLLGYSQYLTWKEYMAIWAKTLGVELLGDGFQSITWNDIHDVVPAENMKKHLADALAYIADFGYDGNDPSIVFPKDLGIENKLTPVEEYIKQEDWSSIL